VDLAVEEGRFVSLVGPSGSGKSSLLRAVIGLQQPLSGTVETGLPPGQIGILFQDDALLPWKTARENVGLGLVFAGLKRSRALAEAEAWLDRLGLAGFGDRFPRHLSGGQRKRVALAQVLAMRPRLILMDEPFASLDAIMRARIVGDVVALVERERISVLLGHPRSRRGAVPLRRGLPAVARSARPDYGALPGADPATARSRPFAHASRLRAAL
jgi:NitT/TauT family transport system ATP-binding protein